MMLPSDAATGDFWVVEPMGDNGGRGLARTADPRVIAGLRSMILCGDERRCERL
jgi:hypothetical protein